MKRALRTQMIQLMSSFQLIKKYPVTSDTKRNGSVAEQGQTAALVRA